MEASVTCVCVKNVLWWKAVQSFSATRWRSGCFYCVAEFFSVNTLKNFHFSRRSYCEHSKSIIGGISACIWFGCNLHALTWLHTDGSVMLLPTEDMTETESFILRNWQFLNEVIEAFTSVFPLSTSSDGLLRTTCVLGSELSRNWRETE